jgi:hypothetical protein
MSLHSEFVPVCVCGHFQLLLSLLTSDNPGSFMKQLGAGPAERVPDQAPGYGVNTHVSAPLSLEALSSGKPPPSKVGRGQPVLSCNLHLSPHPKVGLSVCQGWGLLPSPAPSCQLFSQLFPSAQQGPCAGHWVNSDRMNKWSNS